MGNANKPANFAPLPQGQWIPTNVGAVQFNPATKQYAVGVGRGNYDIYNRPPTSAEIGVTIPNQGFGGQLQEALSNGWGMAVSTVFGGAAALGGAATEAAATSTATTASTSTATATTTGASNVGALDYWMGDDFVGDLPLDETIGDTSIVDDYVGDFATDPNAGAVTNAPVGGNLATANALLDIIAKGGSIIRTAQRNNTPNNSATNGQRSDAHPLAGSWLQPGGTGADGRIVAQSSPFSLTLFLIAAAVLFVFSILILRR